MTTKGSSGIFGANRPMLVQAHSISVMERESIDAKFYNGRFNEKTKLVRRSRASQKKYESKCEICHMIYSSPKVLRQHMEYYGNPKYPCNKCGIKLTDKKQLQFHITYAHADKKVLEKYKFKCPVCNQMGGSRRYLRSHIYHYHNEWAIKNTGKFFSRRKSMRTQTSSDSNGCENEAEHVIQQSASQETSRMECREDVASTSATGTTPESANLSKDENELENDRSSKIHENPRKSETEILSIDIKTEAYDDDSEHSRQSDFDETNENYSDEILKALHSCKECYVPLVRMHFEKTIPMDDVSSPETPEAQISEEIVTREGLALSRFLTLEKTIENLPFEEIQIPDQSMANKNLPFEEIQIPGAPMPMGNSTNFKSEYLNEPTGKDNWSFLGIYEPTTTYKTENQSQGIENVEPSKIIDATVQSQDNCFQLEVIPSHEIRLDEWMIKTESEEFKNTREKNSETTIVAPFSLFETIGMELMSDTTESINKDHNTVIASVICDKYFPSRRSMQRHFRQRHMIAHEDVVFCVCGKPMVGRTEKDKHFYQHCGKLLTSKDAIEDQSFPSELFTPCRPLEKTHVCRRCGEKFWLETCLRDHQGRCRFMTSGNGEKRALTMQIHRQYRRQQRNSGQYVCKQCNSGFNTSKALSQHIQKYSNTENHQCPICHTVFTGRRLLKGHMQSTHDPNRIHLYSVFCEICNQGFTKHLYKRIHIMHCHPVQGMDEAEVIDVVEVSKSVTQKYKRVLTKQTPPVQPVQNALRLDNKCKVCNIVFVSRKRYIDHMIYYKKDEIVYCNICGKHFEGQYMAHHHNKKFHYARDMQKAYTHYCLTCNVGFMYKTHLNAHMSHVHDVPIVNNNLADSNNYQGKVLQNAASLRYICNICEIRFQSATVLANHEIKYSNDGEFACNQCPRKFRTTVSLGDHISINHSEEVVPGGVKCSRCNENLLTRTAWVSHVKHFHNSDGNEPSEFCFENSVRSSKEFANVDVELIPTNDSISSGMAYINFRSTTNPTGRRIAAENQLELLNTKANQSLEASTTRATIQGPMSTEKIWTNCGTCGIACIRPAELAKHTARYSNTGHYSCTICNRRFTWQRFYEDHKAKHFRCDPNNDHFCPICDEGFDSITEMNMHKAHFHPFSGKSSNSNRDIASDVELQPQPEIIDVEESIKNASRQCKKEPFKCITCNAVFLTNRLLKVHENNFHPSISVVASSEKNKEKSCAVGNRFYILDGIEILPEAVDVIQNNFEECNKKLGLTNCIYRYGLSCKCEICGTLIANKELLHLHREKIHTVSSKDPIENAKPEKPNSTEILTVNRAATKRSYSRTITREIEISPSVPESSTKPIIEKSSTTAEPLKKMVVTTFNKSILKSQIIADPDKQIKHYRCKNCDIVFVNTSLLRVHQVNGQCLKRSIEQIDCETVDDEISVIEHHKVAKLTNTQRLANRNSKLDNDIECLKKSGSTSQLNARNTPGNKIISSSGMRLIKLPPGNYKIEKLKVRPLGSNSVKNLLKETETKQKDENGTNVVPVAKRVKKIFDPVTYRELCRQHNLVPTSESQKKKSSTVPSEIVLD